MAEVSHDNRPLSDLLADICDHEGDRISVEELSHRFGGRALGALLFLFGLICMLPLPPGGTTIFGMPLLLLAPQVVLGADAPWLPVRMRRRTISTSDLKRGLPRFIRALKKVEAVSRPRLTILFSSAGERLIGVLCTLLAFVLILPIPLGNILPAIAVTVLSFSLIQRDGFIAILGYAVTAASATVMAFAAHVILAFAGKAIIFFQSAWGNLPGA